jgi:hypothetical protein
MSSHSLYFSQLTLQLSVITEILFVLVVCKSFAIYAKGVHFCFAFSLIYLVFASLLHFQSPIFGAHIESSSLQKMALSFGVSSLVLSGLAYFLWPSFGEERKQYDLKKFLNLLRPFYDIKTWPVTLSLSLLLCFSIVFFKLMVLYAFPILVGIEDGYEEAVFLFGFGMIVGFFLYSFLFKETFYLGRVVALSLALAVLCLLGIGFLSMSEQLVWCLVALVGVFLGSLVLLFRLLKDLVGPEAFAIGCALVTLLAGGTYALLSLTMLREAHHFNPKVLSAHLFYSHLWWVGIFLLLVAGLLSAISHHHRAGSLEGNHVRLFSVLADYFSGKASLKSTFWLLSVVGRWIFLSFFFWILIFFWVPQNTIHLVGVLLSVADPNFEKWLSMDWYHLFQAGLILSLVGIFVSFFMMVSVWRSGVRSTWLWRYLSRVIVVMVFLRSFILLFGVSVGLYLHSHPEVMSQYFKSPWPTGAEKVIEPTIQPQ